jgi:hypothetical protein
MTPEELAEIKARVEAATHAKEDVLALLAEVERLHELLESQNRLVNRLSVEIEQLKRFRQDMLTPDN